MVWLIIGIISGAAIFILFIYMWRQAYLNKVHRLELAFDEFPKSFKEVRIFFISDIHRRVIDENLITEVQQADMVIIGGDIMEKGVAFEQVQENVQKLTRLGPVFFVWGNNDYEVDYRVLDALLLHNGVKILDNTAVTFHSDEDDTFALLGVDSLTNRKANLGLALSDGGDVPFRILACHDPRIVSHFEKKEGIQLVLSGHTHGGQIRLFGFGKYELGGLKQFEHTTMLVSNGYGTTLVPLRLGAPAQTHLIILKPLEK